MAIMNVLAELHQEHDLKVKLLENWIILCLKMIKLFDKDNPLKGGSGHWIEGITCYE